jgi:hypothetical protein
MVIEVIAQITLLNLVFDILKLLGPFLSFIGNFAFLF